METKYKYITTAVLSAIVAFMISLGVDVSVDTVAYDQGYLPYSCDLENVDDMMCYKLSRVGVSGVNRNCYYDRNRGRKYKICTTGWERIINIDDLDLSEICPEPESYCDEIDDICPNELNNFCELMSGDICPDNDCSICPKEIQYITKYIDKPCVQTCDGCGGGGSCGPCPECNIDCKDVTILAMIPNDDCTETINYYCTGIGEGQTCINSKDLSQELLENLMCW